MLERLKTLSELYGVSGNETRVRAYLRKQAEPYADDIAVDPIGNLYVHKCGEGPRVMLAAHMDEVGMIVRDITESGTLLYDAGGIDPRVVVSKRVAIGPNDVPGVIGAKAIHLQSPEERKRVLKHTDLYVDIGAKDRADAEKLVGRGDYISFTTKFSHFGEGLVRGKALDDRVGCAILLELLRGSYQCDLWAVFTVQEELGLRGATVTAARVQPDVALILEGTTANDMAETPSHRSVTTVGAGAAISFMDGRTIVPEKMVATLRGAAMREGIPWQMRKGTAGGTDAGAIHRSLAGVVCGGISVPCRYIHSPVSVASVADIEAAYRLAATFLQQNLFHEVL